MEKRRNKGVGVLVAFLLLIGMALMSVSLTALLAAFGVGELNGENWWIIIDASSDITVVGQFIAIEFIGVMYSILAGIGMFFTLLGFAIALGLEKE